MPHALAAGDLEAVLHPEAGMICSSLRNRGEEVLGQRDGLDAYVRERKTMGIPFLHPWANRVGAEHFRVHGREVDASGARRDEHGQPNHGLLGPAPWTVEEASDTALRASYDWADAAFPFPHRLELTVSLDATTLAYAVALTPAGDVPVPLAFGFHPYLAISDRAEAFLPVRARQPLGPTGLGEGGADPVEPHDGPLAVRDWDDPYVARDPGAPFVVEDGGRRLEVRLDDEAFPVVQVFAPRGAGVVCVEPMTAPVGALETGDGLRTVAPAETFAGRWSLTVSR